MIGTILHGDMYGIGIAEEVVHIAKNLLIGSHEEHSEIVRLVFLQGMHRQRMGVVTIGCEIGNLTVTVAGDVLDGGITCGTLVKAL